MKILYNDDEFELKLFDTEFVEYWCNWAFAGDDTVELNYDSNMLQEKAHVNSTHIGMIKTLIQTNNDIVNDLDLPERFIYVVPNDFTVEALAAIHEQWAQITKETTEKHLPLYDPATEEVYNIIDAELNARIKRSYPNINTDVHRIEFDYKYFFMHNIGINREAIPRGDYVIKSTDTSFVKETLTIPYYDIGRPQFEKFVVSGAVEHVEVSNYLNIANRVEFNGDRSKVPDTDKYRDECILHDVPCFGPYVNIATNPDGNWTTIGHFFLKNYNDGAMLLRK